MNEDIEELFPFYALGVLTDEERAQVEAYVAANPATRIRLEEMVEASSLLPYEITPVAPSPELKHALMARVRVDARRRPQASPQPVRSPFSLASFFLKLRPGARWRWAVPVFAVFSLTIALGLWALALNQQIARQQDRLAAMERQVATLEDSAVTREAELTSLEAENEVLRRKLQSRNEVLALFTTLDVEIIAVAGTEHQPQAQGKLILGLERESAALITSGLTPLARDKVYQLWLIRGEQATAAGTFRVNDEGQGILVVLPGAAGAAFDAIGVSIEPEGGSEQPSGDIVLLSNISS